MSNCDFVAGGSLIALAPSRLALRAPALRAATALTRPNRPAQRLPCGRHAMPTAQTIGPNDVLDCAKRQDLRDPSLLTRARAQATVRVWKKRPELQAHSRIRISEAPAGFRSRRGRCRESTPVTPQYAPFASYKVASYTSISGFGGGIISRRPGG